jgi:CubicO group peptidase (beta-lactamase class C family)
MEISLAVVDNGTLVRTTGVTAPVPWWSFTKTVIAAGALVLVRDGRLALDEPMPKRPYTLRQLLQHRAGVANYADLAAYHGAVGRGDDPWSTSELMERTEADRLRFEPGKGWSYSNIGYLFVRQLIETTCNEPLGAALMRLVLRPLGIEGARISEVPDDLVGVFMGEAVSYHPGWVYHGLMVGPLDQAALFLSRLLTGPLLPPGLLMQMQVGHVLAVPIIPGRPWSTPEYGLGLMVGTCAKGRRVTGHSGGGPGSVIAVYHSPGAMPSVTAAAFCSGANEGAVESAAFEPLGARCPN